MTKPLSALEVKRRIEALFPQAVEEAVGNCLIVKREFLKEVASFLKKEYELDYLSNLTAVDYLDFFEVVYYFNSIKHNHSLILKSRCPREDPVVPSVVELWKGADFQEREVYDLMGIKFSGHPNLKRIFLWEGFQGHPLRKDYL